MTNIMHIFAVVGVRNYWSLSRICSERWGAKNYARAEADESWSKNPFQGLDVYFQDRW